MKSRARQTSLFGMEDEAPSTPSSPAAASSQSARNIPVVPHVTAVAPATHWIDMSQPAPLAGQTVYVIDANSLIFQVFHAIPEMTSPRGEPVNAVYGFTRDMLFLLEQKKPDYILCAFDLPTPTFRHTLYPEYKGTRSEMPVDLSGQFAWIHKVLDGLGLPVLEMEGYEADDILATLARQTERLGATCMLVSADKDLRQLITDQVKIYNPRKNQIYDEVSLMADWGVRPEQVVDFQSLVGDSVDNVPGVPLIGPKIARELLEKYGTLEGVLEHAGEISGAKRRQNLIDGREMAMLSRQLVRLETELPLSIDWNATRAGQVSHEELISLFGELGFHRFADQIRALPKRARPSSAVSWETNYQTIDTPGALTELVAELAKQTSISFDTETTSLQPVDAEIVGYSFAWQPGQAVYIPVRAPAGEQHLDPANVLAALRPVLENPAIAKVGQNLKYDMLVLRAAGVTLRGIAFDTMVASYLLDAGERNHNMDELALRYLDHKTVKIQELIGSGKSQKRMDEVPVAQIAYYAAEDADVPLRLQPLLAAKLSAHQLTPLFEALEMPLIDVLAELEFNGIRVDTARLQGLSAQYAERLVLLEQEIHALAGHEFNIASPKQLQQILFEEQRLPVLKRTKTGPSTDVEVLEELALSHPLPAKIIEYRQFAKLKNTYVDALPQMVSARTGRVHASFHQAVAATGRLSSSDPNLQNIPIRTEAGREIRSAFLPGQDDWLLLMADYSQIELRVLAHFSGDATLCEAFARGDDIHTLVASQVHGVPLAEVTSEMRRRAKAVNFGVIYGQSAFGLAKSLGIEQEQAAAFIEAYFDRYPGVDQFMVKILEDCRAKGYVETILGRRRAITGIRPTGGTARAAVFSDEALPGDDREIESSTGDLAVDDSDLDRAEFDETLAPVDSRSRAAAQRQRNLPERTAINTVIQGSAADLIKRAMIAIHRRMQHEGLAARMLLQIHDELIFEVPLEERDRLARLVIEEMSTGLTLAVPLGVDVKVGHNWAETTPLEVAR